MLVAGARGRDHDRRLTSGPTGEPRRHRLVRLHHLSQRVEAPADQDVRGVADAVRELVVGPSLRLRRQLALLGDPRVGDLGLELVEATLRVVVVADERERDAQHFDPTFDSSTHVLQHVSGEVTQVRESLGVLGTDGVERVELAQHLVEGRIELAGDDRVADPVHVSVVAVEGIALRLGDAPTYGVVHACRRLVADPDVGATSVGVVTPVSGVGVGLDARVELRDLLPRPLEVDAVAQRVSGPAEAGHHADAPGSDDRQGAQDEADDGRRDGNPCNDLGCAGTLLRLNHPLADERHDHDHESHDREHEKPRKGHCPSFL